jgi:hypothetical protein
MRPIKKRYHIVHDCEGRILALVPAAMMVMRDGIQVGWRPVAGINQFIAQVQLTAAHARMTPHELIEQCLVRVDGKKGTASLLRRMVRPAARKAIKEKPSAASRRRN